MNKKDARTYSPIAILPIHLGRLTTKVLIPVLQHSRRRMHCSAGQRLMMMMLLLLLPCVLMRGVFDDDLLLKQPVVGTRQKWSEIRRVEKFRLERFDGMTNTARANRYQWRREVSIRFRRIGQASSSLCRLIV